MMDVSRKHLMNHQKGGGHETLVTRGSGRYVLLACWSWPPGPARRRKSPHRHAHDRRNRLERFRRLFRRRRGPRPFRPEHDRIAKEARCSRLYVRRAAQRAAPRHHRGIPIRSALSIVVAPGDENCAAQGNAHIADSSRRTATRRTFGQVASWATNLSSTDRARLRQMKASAAYYPASIRTSGAFEQKLRF